MQVVILAGGRGTRAYPFTEYLPKPMMPVGGKPMLLQIMSLYAAQGHKEFIVSVGHRKEVILDYFAHKRFDLDITIADTGEETDTAGRIHACRGLLRDRFMATYGDGLSDVPIDKLIEFHVASGSLATLTSVPLVSQYGTVEFDGGDRVTGFREKPRLVQHWINAGFFVMERQVFDHWQGSNLEREVLPGLVKLGRLSTFRHDGFFKSMDTYKDQQELEEVLARGDALPGVRQAPAQEGTQFVSTSELARLAAAS